METINHEYYVSLEVAKLLKEARFDWKTEYAYVDELFCPMRSFSSNFNSWGIKIHEFVSAPTLDVAQRWLRENYNMHIMIDCIGRQNWLPTIQYMTSDKDIIVQDNAKPKMCSKYYGYDTYEEGLEAGIKKAIEIILEKGE